LLPPASDQLKSEVAIVCGMARATLTGMTIDWQSFEDDYDLIRDKIEEVFPDLFTAFNARIRKPGGFRLPNGASERIWHTPTGKAQFLIFRGVAEDPPVPHPEMLRLASLRSHDQYNTTIYSMSDRYRGVYNTRTVIFMNKDDMAARGIVPQAVVEIESLNEDGVDRRVRGFTALPYDIPRGSVAAYYPEVNPLLALAHHDKKSGTPAGKSIPVLVRAMAATNGAVDATIPVSGELH
jgi:anaerobic selenocysteine-containing dehydrogenase